MNNATITVLLLSIPLALVAAIPFGWLKSRVVYLILGCTIFGVVSALILAGLIASGVASGHGGGDSGGSDGFTPLVLWGVLGGVLLFLGVVLRPSAASSGIAQATSPNLKTLRESEDSGIMKKQNKSEMATPRKPSD